MKYKINEKVKYLGCNYKVVAYYRDEKTNRGRYVLESLDYFGKAKKGIYIFCMDVPEDEI
jgi:hypothetical protein